MSRYPEPGLGPNTIDSRPLFVLQAKLSGVQFHGPTPSGTRKIVAVAGGADRKATYAALASAHGDSPRAQRFDVRAGNDPAALGSAMTMAFVSGLVDLVLERRDGVPVAERPASAEFGSTATGWGVSFDETGQNTEAAPYVMQWRDGVLGT